MYIQSYTTIAERDSVVNHVCQIVTEATMQLEKLETTFMLVFGSFVAIALKNAKKPGSRKGCC